MKKHAHYFGGFILATVLIIIVYLLMMQPRVDSTGKTHVELYEGANAVWDAQATVGLFREQEVDGETIGSSTALSLEWSAPAIDFNHYVVTISTADSVLRSEASEKERARLDLTGLQSETEYTFAIHACLDQPCEEWIIATEEPLSTVPSEVWSEVDSDSLEDPILLNP